MDEDTVETTTSAATNRTYKVCNLESVSASSGGILRKWTLPKKSSLPKMKGKKALIMEAFQSPPLDFSSFRSSQVSQFPHRAKVTFI